MNRLATICARSGSKGLKNKNKLELFGVPLYKRAILQAVDCGYFDFIAVSSDDTEILENALSVGADLAVLRPAELSTDLASKPQTIRHATLQAELAFGSVFDIVADLDVTSPLRLNSDIGGTLQVLESGKHSSVVTVSECHRNPYFNLIEKFENRTFAPAKKNKYRISC